MYQSSRAIFLGGLFGSTVGVLLLCMARFSILSSGGVALVAVGRAGSIGGCFVSLLVGCLSVVGVWFLLGCGVCLRRFSFASPSGTTR